MTETTADKLHMGDLFAWEKGGPTHRVRNADSWSGSTWLGLLNEPSQWVPSDTPVYLMHQ